jgi:hypothetical protein
MKTALKIFGGILATLVVAIFVFWIGWLRPPAPEKVCDNVETLTLAELKTQGIDAPAELKAELRKDCEKWASKRPEFGIGPWVKKLKCARDAKSMKELDGCGVKM